MAEFRRPKFIVPVNHMEDKPDLSSGCIQEFVKYHIHRISSPSTFDMLQDEISLEENEIKLSPKHTVSGEAQDITEDIKALEPHLETYTKILQDNHNMIGNDPSANIPPQLLRVIRFLPHKWTPLKRALLRRPMMNEVGFATRLKLVKELRYQDLISTAEVRLLEETFHEFDSNNSSSICHAGTNFLDGGRKRAREEYTIHEKMKMAFSTLPLDIVNLDRSLNENTTMNMSFQYIQETLSDYCQSSYVLEDDGYPSPELVAEWALLAFSSMILSQGFETIQTPPSEILFFNILFDDSKYGSSKVSSAVKKYIERTFNPDCVDILSDINILCLARFLSLMDVNEVASLLSRVLIVCCSDGHISTGFTTLPKLLATYISILYQRNGNSSFPSTFQSLVESKHLETGMCDMMEDKRIAAYTKIVFQSCDYILEFGDLSKDYQKAQQYK